MSLNVEGYIEEGIGSKNEGEEGKVGKLENNSVEMTKKDEGKKPSIPQKFLQYGIISLEITMRKIHMHHVIIVTNLMLVILERVRLVIYGVTCNQNVENLLIE